MIKKIFKYVTFLATLLTTFFQPPIYSTTKQDDFFPSKTESKESPIVVTLPKAGTHLVRTIVEHLTGKEGKGPIPFIKQFSPKHKFLTLHVTEAASLIENYCHEHPNCPKILVVRNLRDIVVSAKDFITKTGFRSFALFADFFAQSIQYTKKYDVVWGNEELKNTWDSLNKDDKLTYFIKYYYNFKETPDQIMRHNLSYYVQDAIAFAQKYPDALIIRFEDLFDQNEHISLKELKRIANFLGKNLSNRQLRKIAKNIYGNPRSSTYRPGKKIGRNLSEFKSQHISLFESYFENEEKEFNDYFKYSYVSPDHPYPLPTLDDAFPLLVTIPKSGTHLLTNLIAQISPSYPKLFFHVQSRSNIRQHCKKHPHCPKILLIRNLRDLVLSRKDFTSREHVVQNHPPYVITHGKAAWELLSEKEKLSLTLDWFYNFKQVDFRRHNLKHYVQDAIWLKKNYPEALVIKFEDLFDDQEQLKDTKIFELSYYLGKNLSQSDIDKIISQVSQNKNHKSPTYQEGKKVNRYLEEFDGENNLKFLGYFENLEKRYNDFFGYAFFGSGATLIRYTAPH